MTLVGVLVVLIVFGLIWWAAHKLMAAFGIGEPISTIITVILVIVFALYLLSAFTGFNTGLRIG